jgi:transketolase
MPAAIKARVSVEAGITHGWERWVGEHGISIGVDTWGASAPDKVLWEKYGFTVAHVVEAARKVV